MSKVAERLAKRFKYNGERTVFVVTRGDDYEALSNLIHSSEVDEDTAYEEVLSALDSIAEEGIEHIEDNIYYYCEADVYTRDLLEWVSRHTDNVAWCNEATACGAVGFVDTIMRGQSLAKQHVWRVVIDLVREMEEKEDGEDSAFRPLV